MEAIAENFDDDGVGAYEQQLYADLWPQLKHVLDGHRINAPAYPSLRNLDDVVGTQYGNRVIFELIQNAHDAHQRGDQGEIAIRLVIRSDAEGDLYVANRGRGFSIENVRAIKYLAMSNKEVGEGIGNKGLGFRSVELLSSDVQIFSQPTAIETARFDGFCFRFARESEVVKLLQRVGATYDEASDVSRTVPHYICAVPISEQDNDIRSFAEHGFATVIKLPLRNAAAVKLARDQVDDLIGLKQPVLLFLDRVHTIAISTCEPDLAPVTKVLKRKQRALVPVADERPCDLFRVDVGDGLELLMVRRIVEKARIREAVEASIAAGWPLERWREWKGDAVVSIAVPWNGGTIAAPCLYNFLPMSDAAKSPLHGYVDAPFYTEIDRRNVNLSIPLNEALLTAVSEACAVSALALTSSEVPTATRNAVTDLVSWDSQHAAMLNAAFESLGTSLAGAAVFPTLRNATGVWGTLIEIVRWPQVRLSTIKPQKIATLRTVQVIPGDLSRDRVDRIANLARRYAYRSLDPTVEQLADWIEVLAADMHGRKQAAPVWSAFYDDVHMLFEEFSYDLNALRRKRFLLDRNNRLLPAVPSDSESGTAVFYRAKTRMKRQHAPSPPHALSRRYRFLNPRIELTPATAEALESAGILRTYDAIEALSGLAAAIGTKPSEERRKEALAWVFDVWRTDRTNAEAALESVSLDLPTFGGWTPATDAYFSSTWTTTGGPLEDFLVMASLHSADCSKARAALLLPFSEWPWRTESKKPEWLEFLTALGVRDGIAPIAVEIGAGTPSAFWNSLLTYGRSDIGLDRDWCSMAGHVRFASPGGKYQAWSKVWRLPGQLEYDNFDSVTRAKFSELMFHYLKTHKAEHLIFQLAKSYGGNDTHAIPTPMASFIRCKPWIAIASGDEWTFYRPDQVWSSSRAPLNVPVFIARLPNSMRDSMLKDPEFAALIFGPHIGVLDWSAPASAVDRLSSLAEAADTIESHDQASLRRQTEYAWEDAVSSNMDVPATLNLIVDRDGSMVTVAGSPDQPTAIVVADRPSSFEARILSDTGANVLHIGESTDASAVVRLLNASGGFDAMSSRDLRTELIVDGEPFVPDDTLPDFATFGLQWLGEVIALAHVMKSQDFGERSLSASTIMRRFKSLVLRQCKTFALAVGQQEVAGSDIRATYGFAHDRYPCVVTTAGMPFTWSWLAKATDDICRLISPRLRSATPVLLQLGFERASEALARPSHDALAAALGCDIHRVYEQLAALRNDKERLLQFLLPAVAYYCGIDMAKRLQADAERYATHFDIDKWVRNNAANYFDSPRILSACREANDMRELRRDLGMDLGLFNNCLSELGLQTITYEAELRTAFNAYLKEFRNEILDRLRARYLRDYEAHIPLSEYVAMKNLDFVPFNSAWIATLDSLDQATAKAYIDAIATQVLGRDTGLRLPSLSSVLDANRRTIRTMAKRVALVIGAWCYARSLSPPPIWTSDGYQEVAKSLEDTGVLDFRTLEADEIAPLFASSGIWPQGMPETFELAQLGLSESDLTAEEVRRTTARESRERESRTVFFAGDALDPLDPEFPLRVQGVFEGTALEDCLERSRRVTLAELPPLEPNRQRANHGRAANGRNRKHLRDEQKDAMGLVSERLAFEYLRRQHQQFFDESCWVSTYRRHYCGGSEGNDAFGYDFCVRTPRAECLYEVKSTLDDSGEIEMTANEIAVASEAARHPRRRRYRILYVPFVFEPQVSYVAELPNPMEERSRGKFITAAADSVRFRFKIK